jgi:hypothetical protein
MVSSPRPAWAFFAILFLFHRFTRTFFQSVSVVFWHRTVSMPFLAPNAHFLPDEKTPPPWFPVRGDGQPVKRSKPRVGHGGQTGLTELHCDGLLKFKSGSDELSHLTTIVSQLVFALAVGQVKSFHADKFDLKLFDLLEREMRESGLRFASKHLAHEEREGVAVREHGLVHDLDWQAVAKKTARD